MISLKPIHPGHTIGIVAPASPFDRRKFEYGIKFLEDRGYQVHVPAEVFHQAGFLAGADDLRARLINQMFADPEIHAIWCARGGYGSLRILPLIDYSTICAHPKPFVGSSDITALLAALGDHCGMPVFHGPMIISFADSDEETRHAAFDIFREADGWTLAAESDNVIHPGRATGVVVGGNLTTLSHLIGTPFEPEFSGRLLFIEDIGEAPYRIDRMLTQMKLAGKFSGINGLMLGNFSGCGNQEEIRSIVENIFRDQEVPILAGLPAGHGPKNIMMPMGVEAALDAEAGRLIFRPGFFDNHEKNKQPA